MKNEYRLPGDVRTFKQASEELGIDYNKLRQFVYYHGVPYQRLGFPSLAWKD